MSNERWWLVEGVIVEHKHIPELIGKIGEVRMDFVNLQTYSGDIEDLETIMMEYCKPRGVPFDCMPEWADMITFANSQFGIWTGYLTFWNIKGRKYGENIIYFPDCHEEWKGKTFEITNELRELLK